MRVNVSVLMLSSPASIFATVRECIPASSANWPWLMLRNVRSRRTFPPNCLSAFSRAVDCVSNTSGFLSTQRWMFVRVVRSVYQITFCNTPRGKSASGHFQVDSPSQFAQRLKRWLERSVDPLHSFSRCSLI